MPFPNTKIPLHGTYVKVCLFGYTNAMSSPKKPSLVEHQPLVNLDLPSLSWQLLPSLSLLFYINQTADFQHYNDICSLTWHTSFRCIGLHAVRFERSTSRALKITWNRAMPKMSTTHNLLARCLWLSIHSLKVKIWQKSTWY